MPRKGFTRILTRISLKLSRPIDLGTSENWEVGVCELCSSPPLESSTGTLSQYRTSIIIIAPILRLLTYSTHAASHLSNSYWYSDNGDMNQSDPMAETYNSSTNDGFIARWARLSGIRDVNLWGFYILICLMSLYFYCLE